MELRAEPRPTPTWLLVVAWAVVVTPLAWGVYQSVMKSLPLFQPTKVSGSPGN